MIFLCDSNRYPQHLILWRNYDNLGQSTLIWSSIKYKSFLIMENFIYNVVGLVSKFMNKTNDGLRGACRKCGYGE